MKGSPGPGSPHGIYYYDVDRKQWVLVRQKGESLRLGEKGDGLYVVYFNNAKCAACRAFTPQWDATLEMVTKKLGRIHAFVVLCDWFQGECSSEAAASSFREFDVSSSPTVVVARVSNGSVEESTNLPGFMRADELFKIIKKYWKS